MREMLIMKSYEALPKGGHIAIYDFYLDEKAPTRGKADNYLLSIHMQTLATGSQFSFSEMKRWLEAAGFVDIQTFKLD